MYTITEEALNTVIVNLKKMPYENVSGILEFMNNNFTKIEDKKREQKMSEDKPEEEEAKAEDTTKDKKVK